MSETSGNAGGAGSGTASGGGGWFSGIMNSVSSSLTAVRRDLAEFVDTVKDDTSLVVHESVETIKEGKSKADLGGGVRRAVSGLVDNITTSIATDSSGAPSSRRRSKRPDQPFDRAQAEVLRLQQDRETYLVEPEDQTAYEEWKKTFDLQGMTDEISKLLSNDERIRKIHTELIPEIISYNLFWHRYFFRLHTIKLSEQRRQELVNSIAMDSPEDEEEFGDWDDFEEEGQDAGGSRQPATAEAEAVAESDDAAPVAAAPAQPARTVAAPAKADAAPAPAAAHSVSSPPSTPSAPATPAAAPAAPTTKNSPSPQPPAPPAERPASSASPSPARPKDDAPGKSGEAESAPGPSSPPPAATTAAVSSPPSATKPEDISDLDLDNALDELMESTKAPSDGSTDSFEMVEGEKKIDDIDLDDEDWGDWD